MKWLAFTYQDHALSSLISLFIFLSRVLFAPFTVPTPSRLTTFRHKQLKYLGASGSAWSSVNIQRAACHWHNTPSASSLAHRPPSLLPPHTTAGILFVCGAHVFYVRLPVCLSLTFDFLPVSSYPHRRIVVALGENLWRNMTIGILYKNVEALIKIWWIIFTV